MTHSKAARLLKRFELAHSQNAGVASIATQASLWQEAAMDGVGLITSWLEQFPFSPMQKLAGAEAV